MVSSICNAVSRDNGSQVTFHNRPVHILQIGIGTNNHFADEEAIQLKMLLQGTTKQEDEPLTAIGVDPVPEWLKKLDEPCRATDKKVALIVGAVGRAPGTRFLHGLRATARQCLEKHTNSLKIAQEAKDRAFHQLDYLENMARLDDYHPHFHANLGVITEATGLGEELCDQRPVDCYTFRQILEMVQASACEVLHTTRGN